MIEFKKIELSDKQWVDEIFRSENPQSSDFSFASIYVWDDSFKQQIARVDDRLVVLLNYLDEPFYASPTGIGDVKPVLEQMITYAAGNGFPFLARGVTETHKEQFESCLPGRFEYTEERDYFDYLYLAEKMATLSGKKLHGKRNHIHRFIDNNPDWLYEPITPENIPACVEMLDDWTTKSLEEPEPSLRAEHDAILRSFDAFSELELDGGLIRVDGRVIAFTTGCRISTETFHAHFEKAYADIQGAYPLISREFAKAMLEKYPDIKYINREDDMGKDNLRRAKESFYPEFLLKKYTVTLT